jgi:hypothetical protein
VGHPPVEVTVLPVRTFWLLHRDGELQGLDRYGEGRTLWFAHEDVNVFGHDDVCRDEEVVPLTHCFQRTFEEVTGSGGAEVGKPPIARECYKVQIARLLVTHKVLRHGEQCTTWVVVR